MEQSKYHVIDIVDFLIQCKAEGKIFDLGVADPPYNDNHVKYGTEKVNKKKVVHLASEVINPGGHLVWLDTIIPIWAKSDGWKLAGTIGLLQSTNHQVRVVSIFEKVR